eukprot:TRINITY_DN31984_c0_g1_i1.p1 TRINITY_DN31984_c0_g1~~TRINITY_DN31984_c0_g1_i1.p1  ORF type:complete len:719 (+),score=104.90 TRINITY_DN31984_c0_g1_i1:42-2198(+)
MSHRSGQQHTFYRSSSAASTFSLSQEVFEEYFCIEEDADLWDVQVYNHCCSRFVMTESNWFRRFWEAVADLLLVYTGTVFLFRICFVEFHIEEPIKEHPGWDTFDDIVNGMFIFDLCVRFFFSYRAANDREVDSFILCAQNYFCGYFFINLIACLPGRFVALVFLESADSDSSSNCQRALRIARLQRAWRLCRLVRLQRIAHIVSRAAKSPSWRSVNRVRCLRIFNFGLGLMYVVHVMACGWYLCAALHYDPSETWVALRTVDSIGAVSLLSRGPAEQWVHAMYFILTVFSTVGFGDMAPRTTTEIIYVGFTMMVGAVVHSSLVGEVIAAVRSESQADAYVSQQTRLVEDFAKHVQLDSESQKRMRAWVCAQARGWLTPRFDQMEMKQLVIEKGIPWSLMVQLKNQLFRGKLVMNRFFHVCGSLHIPPRLPLTVALMSHHVRCSGGDIVYRFDDFPFNMYIVLQGTFAHIALPSAGAQGDVSLRSMSLLAESVHSSSLLASSLDFAESMLRKGTTSSGKTRTPGTATCDEADLDEPLYPYHLVSSRGYFGEVELIRGCARRSTVRCESVEGTLLVIRRDDFMALTYEFPQFYEAWRGQANRRSIMRQSLLNRHNRRISYRHLAACWLQRFFRSRRTRPASTPTADPKLPGEANKRLASAGLQRAGRAAAPGSRGCDCASAVEHLRGDLASLRFDFEALRNAVLAAVAPQSQRDGGLEL